MTSPIKTILVVDDEDAVRDTLAEIFELEGYRAISASTGAVALQQLREDGHGVCLIILDLRMPDVGGVEFLRLVQDVEGAASIPVIVSTSDPAGAPSGFLLMRKPVNVERMLDAVRGVLGKPDPVPSAPRRRVLLIEADEHLASLLGQFLEDLGFDVSAVSTLREGLRAISQTDFSLVLTDWLRVPEESPWSTVEIVRRRAAPAPVLLLSASPIDEDPRMHGFAGVLRKPFKLTELADAIASVTATCTAPRSS